MLLSTIINKFSDSFFSTYKKNLLPSHIKALKSMACCRHEQGPHMLARCSDHQCGEQIYIPHSCGHRNCPHCQNHESRQWLASQLDKRLPCQYYLITFTLPGQLRDLAWKHQKIVYSLMFRAVQDLLKSFTNNDKKLGGSPGFTAILHTHSRILDYHPHIHVVMSGASINRHTGLVQQTVQITASRDLTLSVFGHLLCIKVLQNFLCQWFFDFVVPWDSFNRTVLGVYPK